jgi:multiple sugar transport system substrate-binding protein
MTLPAGVDRKKPLADIYAKEVIDNIMEGLDNADRWGVKEGELAQASRIINSQVINRLTREFIDGERDVDATADMINEEIAKIQ